MEFATPGKQAKAPESSGSRSAFFRFLEVWSSRATKQAATVWKNPRSAASRGRSQDVAQEPMLNLSASLSGQHRPSEGVFFLGIDPIRSGSIETARILALHRPRLPARLFHVAVQVAHAFHPAT